MTSANFLDFLTGLHCTFALGRHDEDVTEGISVVQQPVLVVWHWIRVPGMKYPAGGTGHSRWSVVIRHSSLMRDCLTYKDGPS